MSATRDNSPKRVRFEGTSPTATFVTPFAAAEAAAATASASLPTSVFPYSRDMAKHCIQAYRTLHEQEQVLKNVQQGSSIPRSARTSFVLTTQRRFENDPTFGLLQQEANDELAHYQAAIKGIIVKKIEFEIAKMKEEVVTAVVGTAFRLVKMILVAQGEQLNDAYIKRLTKLVFSDEDVQRILCYDTSAAIASLTTEETSEELSATDVALGSRLVSLIGGILIHPLKVFRDKYHENKLLVQLRAIATFDSIEGTTAATAMAVDNEPTVPPESIRDEVKRHVDTATKGLNEKIDSLLQALKNEKEGPTPGASSKKKSGKKNRRPAAKVDDAANATHDDAPKRRNKSKKKNTKNSPKRSNNGKTK